VEVPELKEGENSWALLTRFFEKFLGHMETYVWPVDPEADVHPTMLPFVYTTPTREKDERFEKELCYLLTIGLQGQAFAWKYRMAFDLLWDTAERAYRVELTSVRRTLPHEAPKPPISEVTIKE
jgi:hypothetical protein